MINRGIHVSDWMGTRAGLRSSLRVLVLFMGLCSLGVVERDAEAYALYDADWPCSGNWEHWDSPAPPTYPGSSTSIRLVPFYQVCDQSLTADQLASIGWALWMWVRENTSALQLYNRQNYCVGSGSGWYDNGNELNQFKFTPLSGSTAGICAPDTTDCGVCWGCEAHVNATDIKIDSDITNLVQNSIEDCFDPNCNAELVAQHEVGHAYRLDHFEAWSSLMNSDQCYKACNVGDGYHSQPMADDIRGLMSLYDRHWLYPPKLNLSGMPYYRVTGGAHHKTWIRGYTCGMQRSLSFTYFNYYGSLSPGYFPVRVVLIPKAVTNPLSSDIVWAGSTSYWTSVQSGATYPITLSFAPFLTDSPGTVYRAWVQIDPYNTYSETDDRSETDEGDNFIPMDVELTGSLCEPG